MPAHFAIAEGDDQRNETTGGSHEWVVLVGGNGQTMMVSETYPAGHGNAARAVDDVQHAFAEALTQPLHYRSHS